MKTIALPLGIAKIVFCTALFPSHVYGYRLVDPLGLPIEKAVEHYSNIAVVRIVSGTVLKVAGFDEPCGILYGAEVDRDVKGRIGGPDVLFLSRKGFTVSDKYLIFLSDAEFATAWRGREKRDFYPDLDRLISIKPHFGPGGEDGWLEACAIPIGAQDSKVFLASSGTSLRYTTLRNKPDKNWFATDDWRLSPFTIYDELDVQADIISMVFVDRDDDELILHRRTWVSEESIIDWILDATNSNGQPDVQPPTAEVESTPAIQDRR